MENMELNINEMENASGGNGGSPTPLPPKAGMDVYRIQGGENLTRIAKKFNTTVDFLVAINPTITDKNFIRAGFYMYVPKQN